MLLIVAQIYIYECFFSLSRWYVTPLGVKASPLAVQQNHFTHSCSHSDDKWRLVPTEIDR